MLSRVAPASVSSVHRTRGRILGAAFGAATQSALAVTGVQLNMLLAAIVVLVGTGAGLTVVARRRLQV